MDLKNWKKVVNKQKKRPLKVEIFLMVLINKCFLVPTCKIKPLLHTLIHYSTYLFFVAAAIVMLPNCHMCQFSFSGFIAVKTERVGFEPTNSFPLNDFESFAFDHSATSPQIN